MFNWCHWSEFPTVLLSNGAKWQKADLLKVNQCKRSHRFAMDSSSIMRGNPCSLVFFWCEFDTTFNLFSIFAIVRLAEPFLYYNETVVIWVEKKIWRWLRTLLYQDYPVFMSHDKSCWVIYWSYLVSIKHRLSYYAIVS